MTRIVQSFVMKAAIGQLETIRRSGRMQLSLGHLSRCVDVLLLAL